MASLEELLRYLEQFMSGHLYQQQTGTPHIGGLPGGVGGLPGGVGGLPGSAGAPGGGAPAGGPPGGGAGAGVPQPPPGLASAPPEQVQQALQQFAEMHPELASYLPAGGEPLGLAAALGHLGGIPGEALQGFSPALADLELSELGGLLSDDVGAANFGGVESGNFGGFDSVGADPSFSDLDHLLGGLDGGVGGFAGETASPFGQDVEPALPFGDLSGDFGSMAGDFGASTGDFSDFAGLGTAGDADAAPSVDFSDLDFSGMDLSGMDDSATNLMSDSDLSLSDPATDAVQGGVADDVGDQF